ncbi:MAG: hypothetical protein Unbinned3065contig1007_21 [Prokaryotic dsDNA virus sp.]|nr:MAG: hypothetical protein Unbinned3065contig1007_21 [Prokaryotic dsDNA virus sp.]|tara:strand:- start:11991 stop:12617 length:627 start_codon:yes stop_codon:yes gene_type:complete
MEKPSYYATLTAEVRYDKNLTANAKLLYAEITALCNMNGQCFATNKYFANLYGKSKVSISKWISELISKGYIISSYTYKIDSKEIDKRYLSIVKGGIKENINRSIKEKFKDNTINNNTNITYSNKRDISILKLEVAAFDTTDKHKEDFLEYWLETNTRGKTKFQMQKTWSTNRRLKTWIRNYNNWWQKNNSSKVENQLNEYIKGKQYL